MTGSQWCGWDMSGSGLLGSGEGPGLLATTYEGYLDFIALLSMALFSHRDSSHPGTK